jgi:maleylacetoacetate isomerase
MSNYKLYSYWRSSSSYRVRIALNYKEVEFETIPVHLINNGGEQNAPEYKALNPMASVPTLIDGDFTLTQSCAILEYIEEKYPRPPLLPEDPQARAFIRQIVNLISCDIHPLNNLRVLTALTNEFDLNQAQKTLWYGKWVEQGLTALEKMITGSSYYSKGSPYCTGEEITFAEVCLIPEIYNARRFEIDLSSYPTLTKIEQNCLLHPAFTEAGPEQQPDTPEDQRPMFLRE